MSSRHGLLRSRLDGLGYRVRITVTVSGYCLAHRPGSLSTARTAARESFRTGVQYLAQGFASEAKRHRILSGLEEPG
jgi:hypothetical protein